MIVTCLSLIFTIMVWSPEERARVSLDPLSFLLFIELPPSQHAQKISCIRLASDSRVKSAVSSR